MMEIELNNKGKNNSNDYDNIEKEKEIQINKKNFNWPKNLTEKDLIFLNQFLEELKKFDIYKYFHKDVDNKGKEK